MENWVPDVDTRKGFGNLYVYVYYSKNLLGGAEPWRAPLSELQIFCSLRTVQNFLLLSES